MTNTTTIVKGTSFISLEVNVENTQYLQLRKDFSYFKDLKNTTWKEWTVNVTSLSLSWIFSEKSFHTILTSLPSIHALFIAFTKYCHMYNVTNPMITQ